MQNTVDQLIVGGGLAGLLLAYELINKGQKVKILQAPNLPSSSRVAAGTWNPVAFKQFCLSWRAEEMLAKMEDTYPQLENLLAKKFYHKIKVKKIITEANELNHWNKQAGTAEMGAFLNAEMEIFRKDQGYLAEVKGCGRVDLPVLLDNLQQHFEQKNVLNYSSFDYSLLQGEEVGWRYQNIIAKQVIFCEGSFVKNNPYFSWLPLKPAKGDVLTIFATTFSIDYVLKKNIFVLPLGNGYYQVGATYDWEDLTWEPSEKAKNTLVEKLKGLIQEPFEVVGQQAGIRPAAADRRPLIGEHPQNKGLFTFNGLGAKGVFLAPLLAKELSEHLTEQKALHPETDIKRVVGKYFN